MWILLTAGVTFVANAAVELVDLQIFPEDVYFLSEMPSEISIESILSISVFSIIITILASLFPSLAVTKIEPIKALKYE